jgi:hypothetical protein
LRDRLVFAAQYLALAAALNFVWEMAQLPLYTIWSAASLRESLFAAVHCTAGDLLIGAATLALAVVVGGRNWPKENFVRVLIIAVGFGAAYTVFSEWLNVEVRGTWAYASAMPRLPWIGTGLAPLNQWLVVPAASLCVLRVCCPTDDAKA